MYKALDVARYVIKECYKSHHVVSNLKLQKILYFIQAEFLVEKNERCFSDDIEAWAYGPVVPEVYRHYKIYGNSAIPYNEIFDRKFHIAEDDGKIISEMTDYLAPYSASALVEITHHQAPWIDSYVPGQNNVITPESILNYFKAD